MTRDRKAILVVSFGTSYSEARKKTIGAIEGHIAENLPGWEVRRAFTSRMIIEKIEKQNGERIDFITDALERLISDGIRTVVVQPTLVMNGIEFEQITDAVSKYRKDFDSVAIGRPLLTTGEDYDDVVRAIDSALLSESRRIAGEDAAVILMGHGSEHYANASYSQLYLKLRMSGYTYVHITTVEGFPDFGDTVSLMRSGNYRDAVLFPFMVVAGDHARNDLAGAEEGSLRSIIAEQDRNTHCVLKGLGEYPEFRDLFLARAMDAIGGI